MIRLCVGDVTFFGLLPENIERLKAGEPILASVTEPEMGAREVASNARGPLVALLFGETPEAIIREIARAAGMDEVSLQALLAVAGIEPEPGKMIVYRPTEDGRRAS